MKSSLITRNIRIDDRRTSVRLEPQLWRALETIAELEKTSVNELCTRVEGDRGPEGGFTSALRVFIVEYFGAALREERGDATAESAIGDDIGAETDLAPDRASLDPAARRMSQPGGGPFALSESRRNDSAIV